MTFHQPTLPLRADPRQSFLRFASTKHVPLCLPRVPARHKSRFHNIPIGNKGKITIAICTPENPSGSESPRGRTHDLIIKLSSLPSGVSGPPQRKALLRGVHEDHPQALADATNTPVAEIRYRAGVKAAYPGPVHDVGVGFGWCVEFMRERVLAGAHDGGGGEGERYKKSEVGKGQDKHEQLRVAVTGNLLGGSLAVALGLTECRVDAAARVTGVFVREPVLDWVFEGDVAFKDVPEAAGKDGKEGDGKSKDGKDGEGKSKEERDKKIREKRNSLNMLRNHCFKGRYPYTHFDPFASPIHFLRSPSRRVAREDNLMAMMGEDMDEDFDAGELEDQIGAKEEDYAREVGSPSITAPTSSSTNSDANSVASIDISTMTPSDGSTEPSPPPRPKRIVDPDDPRRFKRPLRYPPSHQAAVTTLPDIRIETAQDSLLRPQAEELVRLLRRGLLRGRGFKMTREIERALVERKKMEAMMVKGEEERGELRGLIAEGWRRFEVAVSEEEEKSLVEWLR